MKSHHVILILLCILIQAACNQQGNSTQLLDKATDLFVRSGNDDLLSLDSAISIIDKALDLDSTNVQALELKSAVLFKAKKPKRLIVVVDKLLRLAPKEPRYLIKKALYLELNGQLPQAQYYYKEAIEVYKKRIQQEENDFDTRLAFLGVLEAINDTIAASKELQSMKMKDWTPNQTQILTYYETSRMSLSRLRNFWDGKLSYDEIDIGISTELLQHDHE